MNQGGKWQISFYTPVLQWVGGRYFFDPEKTRAGDIAR